MISAVHSTQYTVQTIQFPRNETARPRSQFLHSCIHCKKRFTSFPSPAGMSLTKLLLSRNNSVMTSLFPPRESLVVTSRLGTGNSRTFFLRCVSDLHITIVCLFCCIALADLSWEYINRSQIHECRNWEQGRAVPFLGIFLSNFRYSIQYR